MFDAKICCFSAKVLPAAGRAAIVFFGYLQPKQPEQLPNPDKPEKFKARRCAGGMDKLVCPCVTTQAERFLLGLEMIDEYIKGDFLLSYQMKIRLT